uniref:Uncharacterized protein n=1 Tax=Cacopsylla melanoneura TaxID=428564 RepID=A0A8D9FJ68_9HEMI
MGDFFAACFLFQIYTRKNLNSTEVEPASLHFSDPPCPLERGPQCRFKICHQLARGLKVDYSPRNKFQHRVVCCYQSCVSLGRSQQDTTKPNFSFFFLWFDFPTIKLCSHQ